MKCINHPELDAVGVCIKCGRGLCVECKTELGGKTYCQVCADVYSQLHPGEIYGGQASALSEDKGKTANCLPLIEERDKPSKLSTAAMICGVLGFICFSVSLACGIYLAMAVKTYADSFAISGFGVAITLDLLAVIFGVVTLRRNPNFVSRRNAKVGLLLGSLFPILFGVLYILNRITWG